MIEVLPADELPAGLPAPARLPETRDAQGRLLPGAGTSDLARKGALARKEALQLRKLLGLRELPPDHDYQPYHRFAREWRDAHLEELSQTVGAGRVGPGPAAIVSLAALQMAAAQYLFDLTADLPAVSHGEKGGISTPRADLLAKASRLGDSARQNMLACHELTVREAEARSKQQPISPNDALLQSIQGE